MEASVSWPLRKTRLILNCWASSAPAQNLPRAYITKWSHRKQILWSYSSPKAQINLTNNRDQDTNNISSWGNEGDLAWTKVQAPSLLLWSLEAGRVGERGLGATGLLTLSVLSSSHRWQGAVRRTANQPRTLYTATAVCISKKIWTPQNTGLFWKIGSRATQASLQLKFFM